jgi:hypothetical protein
MRDDSDYEGTNPNTATRRVPFALLRGPTRERQEPTCCGEDVPRK